MRFFLYKIVMTTKTGESGQSSTELLHLLYWDWLAYCKEPPKLKTLENFITIF